MKPEAGSTARLEYAAGTTMGGRRTVNEDAFGVFADRYVLVVVDGCGGVSSAERAARLIVSTFGDLPLRGPDFARELSTP